VGSSRRPRPAARSQPQCEGVRSDVSPSEDFGLGRHELLEFGIVAQAGELRLLREFLALLETLLESLANINDGIRVAARLGIGPRQIVMKLRAIAEQDLAPYLAKARETFIDQQTERLIKRTGMSKRDASRVIECQIQKNLIVCGQ